jgi:ligand-binding sensor domain-containing protein
MIFRFLALLLLVTITLAGCEKKKNDEKEVLYHELPGGTIQDMAIDSKGDVWYLTSEIDTTVEIEPWRCSLPVKFTLSKFDHQNYTLIEESPDPLMQIIFDHNDRLWARSYYNIIRFEGSERNIILDNTEYEAGFEFIAVDRENNIWAGGHNAGLLKINDNGITRFTTDNTIMPTNSVIAIHIDQQNILWVAMWNNEGMLRFDEDNWTVYNSNNSGMTNQNIWAVTSTSSGDVWIGTGWDDRSECLMKFDGDAWTNPHPKNESGNLISGTTRKLVTDQKDNIWAVIDSGPDYHHKLYKFDGSSWSTIITMPVNNPISDIEVDAGNRIWVSTYNEGYFILEN